MIISGYKFDNEIDAQSARKLLADYYGLPTAPENVTIYYTDYEFSLNDGFYFIRWVDGVSEVLGLPYDIEVTDMYLE